MNRVLRSVWGIWPTVTLTSTEGPIRARVRIAGRSSESITRDDVAPISWPQTWTRDQAQDAVTLAIRDGRIRC